MADVTGITAVRPAASDAQARIVQYAESVSIGQPLYRDPTNGKYRPADANASETAAAGESIAVTAGATDGYGVVAVSGDWELVGATLTVGEAYVVSANPGGIAPNSDLAAGHYVTQLGRAKTATVLALQPVATGIQK